MLKKRIVYFAALLMMITGVLGTPVICHGEENSDLIAGDDERAAQQTVGEEGAEPVYAENLNEGTYEIEVDSSSSMFRIVHADLTVKDGKMTAVLTLGGTGYLKLFMGTGEEAVAADESAYAAFVEDSEGAYTYEVPVEALNKELECTGFSKRKEKWYDHQIFFKSETLPAEVFAMEAETIDLKDGEYTVQVDLAGGTGERRSHHRQFFGSKIRVQRLSSSGAVQIMTIWLSMGKNIFRSIRRGTVFLRFRCLHLIKQ